MPPIVPATRVSWLSPCAGLDRGENRGWLDRLEDRQDRTPANGTWNRRGYGCVATTECHPSKAATTSQRLFRVRDATCPDPQRLRNSGGPWKEAWKPRGRTRGRRPIGGARELLTPAT